MDSRMKDGSNMMEGNGGRAIVLPMFDLLVSTCTPALIEPYITAIIPAAHQPQATPVSEIPATKEPPELIYNSYRLQI